MEDKILEAREEFKSILEFVTNRAGDLEIHEVEHGIFRYLLRLGRLLLEVFIASVGTGKEADCLVSNSGEKFQYLRVVLRQYLSIFGKISIPRAYYYKEGKGGLCPLDARLNLPERNYSYLLQEWMTDTGVKQTYESASAWLRKFLGLNVPHIGIERVTEDLAPTVDEFNESLENPSPEEEGSILVTAIDCKGIPMCVKDRNPDQPKTPDKPGKKRMACVCASYTLEPFYRAAEHIAASLFREEGEKPSGKRPKRCRPLNKRICASVKQGKNAVFRIAQAWGKARLTEKIREKVILIDGEISLWKLAAWYFKGWTEIIDLMHVIGKLWIAAHQHYKTKSPEAKEYVKERTLLLLKGRLDLVIEDLEISLVDGTLSPKRAETVKKKVLGYLRKNAHRMKYDQYLERGLPITTAIIESGCKNLINDRMERSGMIWSLDGAEAMLKARSMLLQGDWDEFWEHRIRKEKERRYQQCKFIQQDDPEPGGLAEAA
jgi:hypothetical protein